MDSNKKLPEYQTEWELCNWQAKFSLVALRQHFIFRSLNRSDLISHSKTLDTFLTLRELYKPRCSLSPGISNESEVFANFFKFKYLF